MGFSTGWSAMLYIALHMYMDSKQMHLFKKVPGKLSDLNPIENLYAVMKYSVYKLKPEKIEELESLIMQVWNEFS